MHTLLVGLDGSPLSWSAVELGIRWAERFHASLAGIAVVDEPTICRPEPTGVWGGYYKKQRDAFLLIDARRQVGGFLEQFGRRCQTAGVECQQLKTVGYPYQQILREVEHFDVVLLGQETHFHFRTTDRDDETLRKVLKKSARPVVVVPEKLRGGNAVVVAYDGSPQAVSALQAFTASGLAVGQEVHVFCVSSQQSTADESVEEAIDYLHLHNVGAQAHPLATLEAPATVILRQLREHNAGLLVMGAYGRSALRELCFGSLTRTLLKQCPVPLFLCHRPSGREVDNYPLAPLPQLVGAR